MILNCQLNGDFALTDYLQEPVLIKDPTTSELAFLQQLHHSILVVDMASDDQTSHYAHSNPIPNQSPDQSIPQAHHNKF